MPVPSPDALWRWLPAGYLLTVILEAPVLLAGLSPTVRARWTAADPASPRYTVRQRLAAALWLTAVTYPIVVVALPLLLWPLASYAVYVIVAETFAIAVECLLFRWVWRGTLADLAVIACANIVSATFGTFLVIG